MCCDMVYSFHLFVGRDTTPILKTMRYMAHVVAHRVLYIEFLEQKTIIGTLIVTAISLTSTVTNTILTATVIVIY